jgi:hypothetical protein
LLHTLRNSSARTLVCIIAKLPDRVADSTTITCGIAPGSRYGRLCLYCRHGPEQAKGNENEIFHKNSFKMDNYLLLIVLNLKYMAMDQTSYKPEKYD